MQISVVFASVCAPQHIDESVRVNYVYDGDTLQLEDGRKIRLIGIDTPEVFGRHKKINSDVKARGKQARAALQKQLDDSDQRVSLAYGPQRFDRYNRTLAHVFLPDGKNLQAWLIEQGYGVAFTTPPNDTMSDCYKQQEVQAINAKRGIWNMPRYQLTRTNQLNNNSEGFHRLQAKVTQARAYNNKISLLLDDNVELYIYKKDLLNFNAYMLNNLENKNIQVRGWLHIKKAQNTQQNKARFIMTLRHPDNIKVLH
ncbi:MAG: thermonuclease family protein [Gammaproteobacteria bacterium]|nr:thermonuclease family protein [Gammaproteobacteria bacterium]